MSFFKRINIYIIEQYIFFALILSIPFTDFSVKLPIAGYYLPHLFIVLGVGTIFVEGLQHGFRFSRLEKLFFAFMGITFIWYIISNFHGFFTYSFFDQSHWADLKEILFLEKIFPDFFIDNNNFAIQIATLLYFVRMSFMECLYVYGTLFLVIHLYQNNPRKGFYVFEKAIMILVTIIIMYSLIEIPALMGNETFKSFLSIINYHTMSINHINEGWPPVFWPLQIRSIFAEPSFFGLGAAVIFPILLYWCIFSNKKIWLNEGVVFAYVLLAFATRSRTATVLILAELVLFIFALFLMKKLNLRKILKIIIPIVVAFFISLSMTSMFVGTWYDRSNENHSITSMADNYVEDNVTSVVDSSQGGQKRSNSIRNTLNKAYISVGQEHPIFGVGFGMTSYYLDEKIPKSEAKNNELEHYSKDLHEQGERKVGFPVLNYFAYQFAAYGCVGVIIYLLPVFYVLFCVVRKRKTLCMEIFILLIALVGSLASCFSNIPLASIYLIIGLLTCFTYSNFDC